MDKDVALRFKKLESSVTDLQDLVKERLPEMIEKELFLKKLLHIMSEIGRRIESINFPVENIEKRFDEFKSKYPEIHSRKGPGPDLNALEFTVEMIRSLREDFSDVRSASKDIKFSLTGLNKELRALSGD